MGMSHARRVKTLLALLLSLGLQASAASFPAPRSLDPEEPVIGDELGGAMNGAGRPAYRFVEGLSDGVYDFLRSHLIGSVFPGRLSRGLRGSPKGDSYALFEYQFERKEARYLERLRESYPIQESADGHYDPGQVSAWRSWAVEEQVSVAVDSLRDTLMGRYQLELFGKKSGKYAVDRRNWDPGFLTMAGIVGGAFLYLNGLHADAHVGAVKVGLDLRAGLKIQNAAQDHDPMARMAGVELGYKDKPVTIASEWGMQDGRVRNERFGLKYRLKY